MIQVMIFDEHLMVCQALEQLVKQERNFRVVAMATRVERLIKELDLYSPQVLLMGASLLETNCLTLVRKLLHSYPDLKIIIIASQSNILLARRLLEAGVNAYLTKEASINELTHTIKSVAMGQRVLAPAISQQLALNKIKHQAESPLAILSDREMEIVLLIGRGYATKEVAEELHISPKTVHSYRARIYQKLNIGNDVELILLVVKFGLLDTHLDKMGV